MCLGASFSTIYHDRDLVIMRGSELHKTCGSCGTAKFAQGAAKFAQGRPLVVCGDLNSVLIIMMAWTPLPMSRYIHETVRSFGVAMYSGERERVCV